MNYRAIDTHCHPQFPQYDADRDEVIHRALDAGIGMVCVGTDLDTSRRAIALAGQYEGLYCSVGLHPNDNLDEAYDQSVYEQLAREPKVVAIGEIGLDYYRTTEPAQRIFQKERFTQQLALARTTDKPVIIHCRDAHEDMQEILKTQELSKSHGKLRGVIHSFTGTKQDALRYTEMGLHIGLNGIVTFARQYDEAVQAIPLEWILLETDAPYLTPASKRGRRNEPLYIIEVAETISRLKGVPLEDVLQQTTENARRLFLSNSNE